VIGAAEAGDIAWRRSNRGSEVAVGEERVVTLFAEADVENYGVVGWWLFCGRSVAISYGMSHQYKWARNA
jgi:hypothetical protein